MPNPGFIDSYQSDKYKVYDPLAASDYLKPGVSRVLELAANANHRKGTMTEYLDGARAGVSPQEVNEKKTMEQVVGQEEAIAQLPEDKFNALLEELKARVGQRPEPYQEPTLRQPNVEQGIAAALGAVLNPQFAFDAASVPFQHGLMEQAQEKKRLAEQYAASIDAGKEDTETLLKLMQLQSGRDVAEYKGAMQDELTKERIAGAEKVAQIGASSREAVAELKGEIEKWKAAGLDDRKIQSDLTTRATTGPSPEIRGAAADELFTRYGVDLRKAARALTPQEQLTKQRGETEGSRRKVYESQYKLNGARAAKLARETYWMDEKAAAEIARTWKQVDDMNSKIKFRGDLIDRGWASLNQRGLIAANASIGTSLGTLSTQLNALRQRYAQRVRDYEAADEEGRIRIQEDLTGIEQRIQVLNSQYGELSQVRSTYQSGLTGPIGGGYQPAKPTPRSGAMPGKKPAPADDGWQVKVKIK